MHQYSDLSLASKSFVKNCKVIQIINQADLATAQDLFGITLGIGTRNIPPHKDLWIKLLEVGNIINIIKPSDKNFTRKFKELINPSSKD